MEAPLGLCGAERCSAGLGRTAPSCTVAARQRGRPRGSFAGLRCTVGRGSVTSALLGKGALGGFRSWGEGGPRGEGQGLCTARLACSEACSWGLAPLKVKGAVSSLVQEK